MSLIVEDGTGKVDSQTYANEADVRAYATARGATLPADDAALDVLIVKGMDYLESLRDRYQGVKTFPQNPQALQWPRDCVTIDDQDWPNNKLPKELVSALCQCVIEISNGGDLQPNTTTDAKVKSEKVDVLETVYMTAADAGSTGFFQSFPKVDALLAPLIGNESPLRNVRI